MHLLASGSNGSGQLAISHTSDVHIFTPTQFHPSLSPLLPNSEIIDLVPASTHALLLLRTNFDRRGRNVLLGAGTNTLGQLGPKCALWEGVRAETRWKAVDFLSGTGVGGHEEWEAVKIAATWTTSFVVYRRIAGEGLGGAEEVEEGPKEVVVSCGSNDFGELGRKDAGMGTGEGTAASDLPTLIDLGLRKGEKVEIIRGGQRLVIAVISDGKTQRAIGWGANRKGELDLSTLDSSGTASATTSSTPTSADGGPISSKGKRKAKAVSRPAFLPPTPLPLPLSSNSRIVDIRLGASHTLALLSNGSVLAWGSDAKRQIIGLSAVSDAVAIGATWRGSHIFRQPAGQGRASELVSQGANGYGQLLRDHLAPNMTGAGAVVLPMGRRIKGFTTGSEHVLARMSHPTGAGDVGDMDELWVRGWNEHGNLGLGDVEDRAGLVKVDLTKTGEDSGGIGRKIKGIWGGCAASWLWLG